MIPFIDVRSRMTNPAGRYKTDLNALAGIAVHHSVSGDALTPDAGEAEEIAHLEVIDRYHVGQDFGGIGYHLAAFASGRIYHLGDLDGARAHVAGRNHELLGLVAVGTFTDRLPGDRQMAALHEAIRRLGEFAGRNLEIQGHGEWALPGQGTVCPGLLRGVNWDEAPRNSSHSAMVRFNGIAASLESKTLPQGAQNGVLRAAEEFALPPEARVIRLEIALARGSFAVGDGTYAGRVDDRYGARLGIIDACLHTDGTLLYDCPPGTVIERAGCLGYWV